MKERLFPSFERLPYVNAKQPTISSKGSFGLESILVEYLTYGSDHITTITGRQKKGSLFSLAMLYAPDEFACGSLTRATVTQPMTWRYKQKFISPLVLQKPKIN